MINYLQTQRKLCCSTNCYTIIKKEDILQLGVFLPIKYLSVWLRAPYNFENGIFICCLIDRNVVQFQQQCFISLCSVDIVIVFLPFISLLWFILQRMGELKKEFINHDTCWMNVALLCRTNLCETDRDRAAFVTNCDIVICYESEYVWVFVCVGCMEETLENLVLRSNLWSCNNVYRFISFDSIGWWHFALYLA